MIICELQNVTLAPKYFSINKLIKLDVINEYKLVKLINVLLKIFIIVLLLVFYIMRGFLIREIRGKRL